MPKELDNSLSADEYEHSYVSLISDLTNTKEWKKLRAFVEEQPWLYISAVAAQFINGIEMQLRAGLPEKPTNLSWFAWELRERETRRKERTIGSKPQDTLN